MKTIRTLIVIGNILLAAVLVCGAGLIAGGFLYLAVVAGLAGGG